MFRLLRKHTRTVVWWGTSVEILSGIARFDREGSLTRDMTNAVLARFARLRQGWDEVAPSERLRRLAEAIPARYNLRTGDAFQLAAALVWCNEYPRGRSFICFDQGLAQAAEAAGFDVLAQP